MNKKKTALGIGGAFGALILIGAIAEPPAETELAAVEVDTQEVQQEVEAPEPTGEPEPSADPEPSEEPKPEPKPANKPAPQPEPTAEAEPAPVAPPKPEPQPEPELTLAQRNALKSAESYLSFSSFSRAGLIDQLSSEYGEGYDLADATWAVDNVQVDWFAEAVEAAESYLEFSSFSRSGLYDQLTSQYGEQFTAEQANHALAAVGY